MSSDPKLEEVIENIIARTNTDRKDIENEYQAIIEDVSKAEFEDKFLSDEHRYQYIRNILWARFVNMPPAKEYGVIPIGFDGFRLSQKGNAISTIFVIIKTNKGYQLERIACMGNFATLYRNVTLNAFYKVKLGEFRNGGLIADGRAKFDGAKSLDFDLGKILTQELHFPVIRIADAKNHLTKVGSDGYMNRLDWKIVNGFVARANTFTGNDGNERGVCTIIDDSTRHLEEQLTEDGVVIPPGMTVWIAPELMDFGAESNMLFAGTVAMQKDGRVAMNCYSVVPIILRGLQGD